MKNKVLVEIIVPEIEAIYDIYLPINKRIGSIIMLLNKTVSDLTNGCFVGSKYTALYNKDTSTKYDPSALIYNTDIRNGTSLILL